VLDEFAEMGPIDYMVYENLWAAPFATALRRGGAQLVASGRIPVSAVLAALDATE
jgi:hypothetical protein